MNSEPLGHDAAANSWRPKIGSIGSSPMRSWAQVASNAKRPQISMWINLYHVLVISTYFNIVMCFFSDAQYYTVIAQELRSSPGLRGARDMSWLSSAMAMATDKVRVIGWEFHPPNLMVKSLHSLHPTFACEIQWISRSGNLARSGKGTQENPDDTNVPLNLSMTSSS